MSGENEDRAQNFVDNSYVKIKNITLGYTFPKNWLQNYIFPTFAFLLIF